MSDEPRAPGLTKFYERDGVLYRRRWNDPAWTNPVVFEQGPFPAWMVANLLNDAFQLGMAEQKRIIRNALGIEK